MGPGGAQNGGKIRGKWVPGPPRARGNNSRPFLGQKKNQKKSKIPAFRPGSQAGQPGSQASLPWLGWLACCALPWLGLAWACLACLASNNNRPPSAAGGGFAAAVVVAGPGQGKAGKAGETGPGQSKPRLGTTGKPAKPRQSDHGISPG